MYFTRFNNGFQLPYVLRSVIEEWYKHVTNSLRHNLGGMKTVPKRGCSMGASIEGEDRGKL